MNNLCTSQKKLNQSPISPDFNWLIGRLQPPPVFYHPNYGDGGDLLGEERTVTIGSPQETEYADIEDTIRVTQLFIETKHNWF